MAKFGQMIYTRCGGQRDAQGNPVHADGYGLYSLSQSVVQSGAPRDARFQVKMLEAAKDRADSFSYWVPAIGEPMMVFHHFRTQEEDPDCYDRRVLVVVTQALVGEADGCPADMMDPSRWTAWQRSWKSYYPEGGDKEEPDLLPDVSEEAMTGGERAIAAARAREEAFVRDGRQEAVRAALWKLIGLSADRAGDMSAIVIRDTEENVRLWIQAILHALPKRVARKISFCTRVENLQDNQYVRDGRTREYLGPTAVGVQNGEMAIKARIVGVDPQSAAGRSALQPRPDEALWVIDGVEKRALFETDASIEEIYYQAVGTNDRDVADFCTLLDENGGQIALGDIPKLYQAMDEFDGDWRGDAKYAANRVAYLLKRLRPECQLRQYLLRGLGDRYGEIADSDAENGCPALGCLWANARDDAARAKVLRLASERLDGMLSEEDLNGDKLGGFADGLAKAGADLHQKVMEQLFNPEKIAQSQSKWMNVQSASGAAAVYRLVSDGLSAQGIAPAEAMRDAKYSALLEGLLGKILEDGNEARALLEKQTGNPAAIAGILEMGGNRPNAAERQQWWLFASEVGSLSLDDVIAAMQSVGHPEDAEPVLTALMHRGERQTGRKTSELARAFRTGCASRPGAGKEFYPEWLRQAAKSSKPARATERVLNDVADNRLQSLKPALLRQADAQIQLDLSDERGHVELAEYLLDQNPINEQLGRSTVLQFLSDAVGHRRPENFLRKQQGQIVEGVPGVQGLGTSQAYGAFLEAIPAQSEDENIHVAALTAFDYATDEEIRACMKRYAETMDDLPRGKRPGAMCALARALVMLEKPEEFRRGESGAVLKSRNPAQLQRVAESMEKALTEAVRKSGDQDFLIKKAVPEAVKRYGDDRAANLLKEAFEAAGPAESSRPNPFGFISKLLGGKK